MHSAKKKINVYPVLYALISGAVLVSAPMLATAQTASVTIGGPAVSATLALSPASGSHGTNNIFSVNVMLDTHGSSVQGVDIISLHYDPSLLEVQDEDVSAIGVQVAPGVLMQNTVFNMADSAAGTITFSQITASGGSFTGSGVLAVIRFKALSSGSAAVTFDFTQGPE